MRNVFVLGVLMTVCVFLAAAPIRAADESTEKFIAKVIADANTNSAKAAKLLETSKVLTAQPKICTAVLEKAIEFGLKFPATSAGCRTASDALDLLKTVSPDRADEWILKRVDVCAAVYRTARTPADKAPAGRELLTALMTAAKIHEKDGDWKAAARSYRQAVPVNAQAKAGMADELRAKLDAVSHRATMTAKAAQYAASIKQDPAKTTARVMLLKLLVVDLNDPGRAVEYLNDDVNKTWLTCVPLAAKGIDDLAEAACMALGVWYHKELAKTAAPKSKSVLLQRAKEYYRKFVELHAKADMQTSRATVAIANIEKELAQLNAPPAMRLSGAGSKTFSISMGKGVTMKLRRMPGGKFMMGKRKTSKARHKDEAPQHAVMISKGFYIGVTEVTQSQYHVVTGKAPSNFKAPGNPVEQVSWDEASAFCRMLSKRTSLAVRLPTEAQWEYACRAGSTTDFSFGSDNDALAAYAWYSINCGEKTHKVALKKPNPAGLYDMHGNVWEWCRDWYDSKFYRGEKNVDPENTTQGKSRVIRGGSWKNPSDASRSTSRDKESPDKRRSKIGFRIVIESR
jgi:formylglycine-generating enzyme